MLPLKRAHRLRRCDTCCRASSSRCSSPPPPRASEHGTPGAAGIGDPLYATLGNGGYDALHYDVDLRYATTDPAQQIDGTVTMVARATQALSRFNLDFGGDSVGSITVDGRAARWAPDGEELVITPRHTLAKGRPFVVQVRHFTATPGVPDPADLLATPFITTPDGTVTAGQPDSTHDFLPTNDHPRDKASYTLRFDVPAGTTAVGNGVLLGRSTHRGRTVWRYLQRQPMASELIQLAVGNYDVTVRGRHAGVFVRDVTPPSLTPTIVPKLAVELEQLDWMEDRVGDYPFDTYGSLVVDTAFGFALETQTLSLYDIPWFTVYGEGTWNPTMLHELAHMWFGDSVAPYEWSDVWLNEGHATWYQWLWGSEKGFLGEDLGTGTNDLDESIRLVYGIEDQLRAAGGPPGQPQSGDPYDVFDINRYWGGALVLFALREEIGIPAFERLERAWVREVPRRRGDHGRLHRARVAHRRPRPRPVPARLALRPDDAADAEPPGLGRPAGGGRGQDARGEPQPAAGLQEALRSAAISATSAGSGRHGRGAPSTVRRRPNGRACHGGGMARSPAYVAVLGLAALCYVALGVVLPRLPGHVTGELGAGTVAVGLAVGAVSLAGVVLRPVGGRIADARGPRPVVVAGALAMAAGAALALLGGGIAWLIATRLVVGAGEGAMMAACVTWLLWLAPPDRRGRAIGHIGAGELRRARRRARAGDRAPRRPGGPARRGRRGAAARGRRRHAAARAARARAGSRARRSSPGRRCGPGPGSRS